MTRSITTRLRIFVTLFLSTALFIFSCLILCSFTMNKMADDFLKQLGISKASADEKISNSILGGSIDLYGVKNAKNIALGNRKSVVLDLLTYTKKQVSSPGFSKAYNEMRNRYKPTETVAKTPQQVKADDIASAQEAVKKMEATLQKADAGLKPAFQKSLEQLKKNVANMEDPNNKQHLTYAKNYEGLLAKNKEAYTRQLAEWERKYPANQLLYVKMRLQEFLNETKDIDFNAELITKNGKKYFVNKTYESKSSRWKMAFRAGKEVIEPAREFVEKWMHEIN